MKHTQQFKKQVYEGWQRRNDNTTWNEFADWANSKYDKDLSGEAYRHIYRSYVESDVDDIGLPVRYSALREIEVRTGNIGIIGDLHAPFIREDYLEFVLKQGKQWDVKTWVCVGDVLDNHANSRHQTHTGGLSSGQELLNAKEVLQQWFDAFPELYLCVGNHDKIYFKQSEANKISPYFLKTFEELLQTPKGWQWALRWQVGNTIIEHGTAAGGKNGAINKAISLGCNIVIGHSHTVAGIQWHKNLKGQIFGMSVSCGVNEYDYAFNYAKENKALFQNGMGIILVDNENHQPVYVPMD